MPHRWSRAAKIRREQIESGVDITFNEIFKPLIVSLVSKLEPKMVLEIGAGTGHISKELYASNGFSITAIEPSKGMYKVAKDVLSKTQVNLIHCSSFNLKKENEYDVAFSHLVAHTVDNIESFFLSVNKTLKSNGYFIFSIPHPCFYNDYKNFFGDEYNYMTPMKKNVSFSITNDQKNIITNVPYQHRPLSEYFNTLSNSRFSVVKFDEIYPNDEIQKKYGEKWKFPRYCLFVCKKLLN